ncbi:MAG: hypothetical protein WCE61_13870 [Candidatus Acidiferrum sp.]
MNGELRCENKMPDVPEVDFVGSMVEIWFSLNCAAYHLAYVRVYLQTAALQTKASEMAKLEEDLTNKAQADLVICRAHLAAFFWQLDHVFEALDISVKRGQKELPELKYFWSYEKHLENIEKESARREINAYRNMAHQTPAIIGMKWSGDHKFLHHFLPTIGGLSQNDETDMNAKLQEYFEYTANIWLSFAPSDFKNRFPRDFRFAVTVPYSYIGTLPPELKRLAQLEVHIEAYHKTAQAGDPARMPTEASSSTGPR